MNEDIIDFFKETDNSFTIYVCEQRFVVGRGAEYFKSFRGKENYIDSNKILKKRLFKVMQYINVKIPDSGELIKYCFNAISPTNIIDIITTLSKLFATQEHQAAGPDVIDPIIIQEGKILQKYVNQLISLHQNSILRPAIIILLKDNDFERAKTVLSQCPHGTNIKMIRNNGRTHIYKVVNCGVNSPEDFLDAFSHHCFNTCSNTKREILLNNEWSNLSLVHKYVPQILLLRTKFLYNDKTLVRNELNFLIEDIENSKEKINNISSPEYFLILTFECVLKLYRVFCNDGGEKDIEDAFLISKTINNDILSAHVYRFSYFKRGLTFEEKINLLEQAYEIFADNKMEDNAIYCLNNKLVRYFDTDYININEFYDLLGDAVHNVPGLVGMPHIFNNVGVAHLITGYADQSIEYFDKGLNYAQRPERIIQKVALLCNKLIGKFYCHDKIDQIELRKILDMIFDNMELKNIPFISSRYALNIISIAFQLFGSLGEEFLKKYPLSNLIQDAFNDNILGSGQIKRQLELLDENFHINQILSITDNRNEIIPITGLKKAFLEKTMLNPFIFSTWF